MDGAGAVASASPRTYSGLAAGGNTFTVAATDAAGNTGTASYTWTIDTAAPTLTITGGPADASDQTSAGFSFTSDDAGGTYLCSLDGAAPTSCSSPGRYTNLGEGSHTPPGSATAAAGH